LRNPPLFGGNLPGIVRRTRFLTFIVRRTI
jgi:hypothetical protein